MTKDDFLRLLEEVLEADALSIHVDDELDALDEWDSLTVMTFIAMADEKFDMVIAPDDLAKAKSVQDLVILLGDKVTA